MLSLGPLSLDFESRISMKWRGGLISLDDYPFPWNSPARKCLGSFSGKGGVLFSAFGVPLKRHSRGVPSVCTTGKPNFCSVWGPSSMVHSISIFLVQALTGISCPEAHVKCHNVCLWPRRPSSMGVSSWAMHVSPTLKV